MKNKRPQTRPSARWKRGAYYLVIAASIAGVAWVLAPSFGGSQATRPPGGDVAEIKGTMSGFSTPGTREAPCAQPAGVYDYYCDVCCGGKANPTMRGKLIVES